LNFLDRYLAVRDHLSYDFGGGPRLLKFAWVINLQKGGTLPFVLLLMWLTGDFGHTAWTYAALHGSYGLCWLFKDRVFPDPNWERRITFGSALLGWVAVLGPYWVAPVLIVTRDGEAPPWLLAAATLVYVLGVVLMMGSDAQKYFVLRARTGLVTDGFFARTRNPNYLGEMMIYASFALVAQHWLPWLIVVFVWVAVFYPNMLRKDRRMARHPGWAAYRARTGLLLPKLSASSSSAASSTASPESSRSGP
jgi:protein-S-isoprenylcysteine O-methyltransferase Ste14